MDQDASSDAACPVQTYPAAEADVTETEQQRGHEPGEPSSPPPNHGDEKETTEEIPAAPNPEKVPKSQPPPPAVTVDTIFQIKCIKYQNRK